MKSLIIFALALSMSFTGFADPTNELAVLSKVSIKEQKAKITLLEGLGRVKVLVRDINGKTIYSTSYKVVENVIMPFNMEKLPAGKYVIRIESAESSIDYEIETTPKAVKEEILPFKANVKALDDRHVKIWLYELLEEGIVTVRVYDQTHRLIFKEKVEGGLFARKYEFKHFTTPGLYLSITDCKGNSQTYYL